jgi:hypothetical protein
MSARYDGIVVHSLHPSNISAEEVVRRGAVGGGYEKGDPGLLRKTGAYRPNGVRGDWGAGGTPTRHETSQRGGANTVPASASRF